MRFQRLRLELRMELATEIVRMPRDLTDFDVRAVRRFARNLQPVRREDFLKFPIEFEAMAVAFTDLRRAIGLLRETSGFQHAGPRAQPHGAAQFVDALQFSQLVNHAMRRDRIELGGICLLYTSD